MSSGPAHRRRAAAAALAPGFRFHPTDEELVGYYLKRKIGGRPFRVNAISDIDLYKSEPWDLPGKSRIQSRDMEWYFFSALDKKYANRSRTNRATGSGYWKTTGKDRPVLCGGRQAGMKKTLVFHIGRAPKGERTNWVMHEYRLEDEELARARVAQDAFVVCRVFQKRGPGPQNGAQYGAPFVEEDWERDDDDPAVEQDDGGFPFGIINDPLLAEVDKSEQTQEWSAQDQAYLLEFQSMFETGNGDGGKDDDFIDHAQMTAQSPAFLNDEFLELNDFALSPVEAPPSVSNISYSDLPASIISEPAAPPVMQGIFNPVEEGDPGFSELLLLDQSAEGSSFLEINDILGAEPTQRNADEETPPFFDASGNLGFLEDDPHFLDSMASSSNGPDMVDELMAYFDATENTEPSELVNFEVGVPPRSNAPWVNRADLQPRRASPETSTRFPDELDGGRTKGGFSGRLVSMLGAISSPPALAAEKNPNSIEGAAVLEKALAAFSPGALRIAPATVQSWPPAKSDVGFLLDYGGGGGFEKPTKFPGGFLVFVQRNSFHLLFLSVLLLAASFKICVCVYSR